MRASGPHLEQLTLITADHCSAMAGPLLMGHYLCSLKMDGRPKQDDERSESSDEAVHFQHLSMGRRPMRRIETKIIGRASG